MNKIIFCCLLIITNINCSENDNKINIEKVTQTFLDFHSKYTELTEEEDIHPALDNSTQLFVLYFISKDNIDNLQNYMSGLENIDSQLFGIKITMLHIAAFYNSINVIGWLVKNGANLALKDSCNNTPLDIAVKFRNTNAATLIERSIRLRFLQKTKQNNKSCAIL